MVLCVVLEEELELFWRESRRLERTLTQALRLPTLLN